MTTSYILKWGISCTVASNFLEKQLISLNDQWSLPWQASKPTRAWALVFIFPAKPFLWSCPTFDVFFVKYHSFSANLAKYALAPQLQLKGWVKDLGFFFKSGWEKDFPKALSNYLHSRFWHFFHGLSHFWGRTLLGCQNATCYKCSQHPWNTQGGNFMIHWGVWLTRSVAQLPGP